MRAAELIFMIIFAPVLFLVVGTVGVFAFNIMEPYAMAMPSPPASLGWGTPGLDALGFAASSFIGVFVVLILYMLFSPIQEDRRQEVR